MWTYCQFVVAAALPLMFLLCIYYLASPLSSFYLQCITCSLPPPQALSLLTAFPLISFHIYLTLHLFPSSPTLSTSTPPNLSFTLSAMRSKHQDTGYLTHHWSCWSAPSKVLLSDWQRLIFIQTHKDIQFTEKWSSTYNKSDRLYTKDTDVVLHLCQIDAIFGIL